MTTNQDIVLLLENAIETVEKNPSTTEAIVLLKMGDEYHRFTSGLDNTIQFLGTLELLKLDMLRRMEG